MIRKLFVDEMRAAREQDRDLVRIRVADQAIAGAPTTVPVSADPREIAPLGDTLELVVHPDDWLDVQAAFGGSLTAIWGVPVVEDA